MNKISLFLADIDPNDLLNAQTKFTDSKLYEVVVMLGAVFLAVVIGSIWAIVYSKKKKKRHHRPSGSREPMLMDQQPAAGSDENKTRKGLRRSRRPHRPMNPTLAQTRGLPPMRDENAPLPPLP
jgi:hypothetical protein